MPICKVLYNDFKSVIRQGESELGLYEKNSNLSFGRLIFIALLIYIFGSNSYFTNKNCLYRIVL